MDVHQAGRFICHDRRSIFTPIFDYIGATAPSSAYGRTASLLAAAHDKAHFSYYSTHPGGTCSTGRFPSHAEIIAAHDRLVAPTRISRRCRAPASLEHDVDEVAAVSTATRTIMRSGISTRLATSPSGLR